jgi:hypothetical protein
MQIVKLVAQKAKISETAAQIAVNEVIKSLKMMLPQAIEASLDTVVSSTATTKTVTKPTTKSVANTTVKSPTKPATKSATKPAAKKTKPADNPLGGLSDIAGSVLGSLLKKK